MLGVQQVDNTDGSESRQGSSPEGPRVVLIGVRHSGSGAALPPRRWSLLPERLELAGALASGPGCRPGHPVCCDLRIDAGQFCEPGAGAGGVIEHVNLRLFV